MPAVVCTSCQSRLKAPPQLAGKTATCPRCRSAVLVPPTGRPVAIEETKPFPAVPVHPSQDTAEVAALDDTALDMPLAKPPHVAVAPPPAPVRYWTSGLVKIGLLLALAVSGGFALWMATPPRQTARPPVVQPRH